MSITVSKEMKDKIREKAGIDEKRIKEVVQILKEWLETQPHLPQDYDEARMETLFTRCKASIEKCKQTIDMYYTLRSAVPEILYNRDPDETWFKEVVSTSCCIPLPELTEDYDRVTIVAHLNQDWSKNNIYDVFKMVFMVSEIRTIEDYSLNDIFIFDFKHVTAGDAAKYTLPIIKKVQVITFQGMKGRLKAIHFINASPFVDSIADIARRLMKPKLAARLHVHRKGSDDLLKTIAPRILPKEYGGDAGSLVDHWGFRRDVDEICGILGYYTTSFFLLGILTREDGTDTLSRNVDIWKKKLQSYRNWFLEQENIKVDESKRPDKSFNASDLFGFEGTFRQLNVD